MLQLCRQTIPSRARFQQLLQDMAEAILTDQQPDGLWHSSLLDPQSYPLKGRRLCFLRLRVGLGRESRFARWRKIQACNPQSVDCPCRLRGRQGKLTHVQPIGSDPKTFADDSTEAYGVGAFLLAGSELYRMAVFENAKHWRSG